MIDDSPFNLLPAQVRIWPKARLSDYTTFKLGGCCSVLLDCPDTESLAKTAALLHAASIDFIVIGQGSNLLVSDEGLEQVVLRYCAEEAPCVTVQENYVTVSGHTLFDDLARITIEQGVGDLSFCSGIPGTVGGAIVGNAGAFGKQIGDVVESVVLLDTEGKQREVNGKDLGFEYRTSRLKETGDVVLSAVLRLQSEDVETMVSERERILALRRSKHPDWKVMPCAGSVFRNIEPTSAAERRQAAGWFLEEAGAKDFHVGGAHLFDRHANIIIADADATAMDVFQLTEKMITAVEVKFGFKLEREVKLLGKFEE
jgi:UDP-N-acetylmuramate dehydrogenase